MKRTNIYCITTPKEAKRLYELAIENGLSTHGRYLEDEFVVAIHEEPSIRLSPHKHEFFDLTKVTPQEMEAVITAKPVYLPMEDWDKFFEQIHFTNPDATRITNAIQSQLKH